MDLTAEDREQVQSMVFEEMNEVSQTIGDLETCKSTDFGWYAEAEADMERYLNEQKEAMKAEEEEEEVEEVEEEEVEESEGPETTQDLLENNRTNSYGDNWEDDPLTDWVPKKITSRSRSKGVTYYRVEWQRHGDPTWETEEDLEEEGHGNYILEYKKEQAAKRKLPQKLATPGKTVRVKKQRKPKMRKDVEGPPDMFSPTTYWPDFKDRIEKAFEKCSLVATDIYNICTEQKGKAFNRTWKESGTTSVPVLLFHGTKTTSIENIVRVGFKIPTPSSGIKVVNGSAYGVGIYSARTPSTSTYYTNNEYMFVCAGLVSGNFQSQIKSPGDMVVFFNEALIMPCFLVKWARRYSYSTIAPPIYHTHFDFNIIRALIAAGATSDSGNTDSGNLHYSMLMQRYWSGLQRSANVSHSPTTLAAGGNQAGMDYDQGVKTLTKRQLRAAPRQAKQQYKAGLLKQKKT
eukprot:TRINITY_DN5047_c0_g1_i1.p1 TRINITY_DN5047_c0_g1~~TRINITY_DN5047_c0_g1_i1.p1  ORF type:complete len:460 (+),score=94.97 TRINITY_DN5047_c0_g1_i1:50-1429(+)